MKLKFGGSREFLESVTKYYLAGKQQLQGVWGSFFNGLRNAARMELISDTILTEIPQSLNIPSLKDIFSYNRLLHRLTYINSPI